MINPLRALPGTLEAATFNWHWMAWNTLLALIPVALAYCLFHRYRRRTALWWLGFVTFIAFLPNAPYVLTDIIHLVHDIRRDYSIWIIALVLVPQYLLFMLVGFEAYVVSVMALMSYLKRSALRLQQPLLLMIHLLCSVGIYLGRFRRFNSWDIVMQPDAVVTTTVSHLMHQGPLITVMITFCVITVLYWVFEQVTLAIAWYWPQRHQLRQYANEQSGYGSP